MTKKEQICNEKNCFYEFKDGETYLYMENEPDKIYCSHGCLFSIFGEPYRYGTIGDKE